MRSDKGFTLIEVLVVVVIISVLAALIVPRITGNVKRARLAEAIQTCGMIARAQVRYASIYGALTTDLSKLDITLKPSTAFPGGSYYAWTYDGDYQGAVCFGLGFGPGRSPAMVETDHKLGVDMIYNNGAPQIVKYWWREDLPGQIGGGTCHYSFTSASVWDDAR
ncbi:MAG TPA: prepilin-type N-terminal cleavage/methylation domain-containing protein [Candidatus Omnitrophota bacterium]|nr:prepilin-type N-terminal cleavage/methylation domain-containing protein [Candidatus Omnitrophota bacterium]HPS37494.1 prepilin-type N-terminal cleavage/methylation domain-containing protein [Candidatus Omnitrophota bacterium]